LIAWNIYNIDYENEYEYEYEFTNISMNNHIIHYIPAIHFMLWKSISIIFTI